MADLIDRVYLEIKSKWNRLRIKQDSDPDILRFLIRLMEMIEEEDECD